MGLFSAWEKRKRVKQAAEQMWAIIRQGINFEVPLSFSQDDIAVQAVVELQRQHPGVELRFYQSRGLVLGLFNKSDGGGMNVSDTAHALMLRVGQLKRAEGKDLTVENFLDQHAAFLTMQGLDPKQQEREAQEARMKREAMEVSTKAVEASTKPEAASSEASTPPEKPEATP
jgi:hypothetical protein